MFFKFYNPKDEIQVDSNNAIISTPKSLPLKIEQDTTVNSVVDTTSFISEAEVISSEETISLEDVNMIISNYYSDLNNDNFDANNYFSQTIDEYINLKNIEPSDVNGAFKNNDYQNGISTVEENSLSYESSEGNISFWSFWISYKCYRPSKKKYQECNVNVRIGVDNNKLIHSYKEIKVKDLKFHY